MTISRLTTAFGGAALAAFLSAMGAPVALAQVGPGGGGFISGPSGGSPFLQSGRQGTPHLLAALGGEITIGGGMLPPQPRPTGDGLVVNRARSSSEVPLMRTPPQERRNLRDPFRPATSRSSPGFGSR